MNIQVQICGIVVVSLLIIMSLNRKTIWLRSKKAFLFALFSTLIALIFDTLSIVAIVTAAGNYTSFTRAVCKTYLVSLVWMAFAMNYYTSVDVGAKNRMIRIHRIASQIFLCIVTIVIPIIPVNIHHTSRTDLYTYGPAVIMTYLSAFIFTVINVTILIIFRRRMNRRRWGAEMTWMFMLVMSAAVQFMNNALLIIGFASAIGTLIVFIRLENPESFIDRESGCFNDLAFSAFLEQCYNRGELISMLTIRFTNPHYLYERYYNENVASFLKDFAKVLDANSSGGQVFKYREWEYVVTFSRKTPIEVGSERIQKALDRPWFIEGDKAEIELVYTEIPSTFIARDAESMLEMMRAFRRDYTNSSEPMLVMDEEWAESYRREQEIEDMIISAIRDDRVKVYYQPIYSTAKKRFVSAEALVRIVNAEGELIPPGAFIPVAEDTGLILEIGRIVFEKACRFMKESKLYEKGIEYFEINLSAVQCMRTDLADEFIKVIKNVGLDPKRINLEITESKAIQSADILISNMEKLRRIGITFSLDDFGTGFSNLDYLLELPINIVKFDRKMTQAYFENEKRRAVMGGVINMIKAVDLEIVAEGVEEKFQLDELSKIDIDFIQGYYFSKPMPAEEFIKLVDGQ